MSAKFQYFLVILLLTLPLWGQTYRLAKAPAATDWKDVDAAMGRPGQDQTNSAKK